MKKYSYQGKNFEDAKNLAQQDLMEQEANLFIKELEATNKLFSKKTNIEVVRYDDVLEYIKDFLRDIAKYMNLTVNIEVKKREDVVNITVYSNNNSILIGKDARTLNSINTILKNILHNELGEHFKFVLDIGEYKVKKEAIIERLAKNLAREVATTKVEAKLEPMNSYERRIVHNILSNNKRVYTESIGEEPNRCVIIKPKD